MVVWLVRDGEENVDGFVDSVQWGDDDVVYCGVENPESCESCQ
jgi:hypothetical protein